MEGAGKEVFCQSPPGLNGYSYFDVIICRRELLNNNRYKWMFSNGGFRSSSLAEYHLRFSKHEVMKNPKLRKLFKEYSIVSHRIKPQSLNRFSTIGHCIENDSALWIFYVINDEECKKEFLSSLPK